MDNFFWFKFTADVNACDKVPSSGEDYNFDKVDWCSKRICRVCAMDVPRDKIKNGELFERVIRIEL